MQRKFVEEQVPVSYPLLTDPERRPLHVPRDLSLPGELPVARAGTAGRPEQRAPFEKLEAAVVALLARNPPAVP